MIATLMARREIPQVNTIKYRELVGLMKSSSQYVTHVNVFTDIFAVTVGHI